MDVAPGTWDGRGTCLSNLASLHWKSDDRQAAFHTARRAVETVEAQVSQGTAPSTYYSFKADIEPAYRIRLADPALNSDPDALFRVVESLRQGELLSAAAGDKRGGDPRPDSPAPVETVQENVHEALALVAGGVDGFLAACPPADDAVYLAIQQTVEGTLFLIVDGDGARPVFSDNQEWNEAARSIRRLLYAASGAKVAPAAKSLAEAGQQLWNALPEVVQDVLSDERPVYLSPDGLTSNVPLEFLCPSGNAQDFIGLQKVLPRTPGVLRYSRALQEATICGPSAPSMVLFANPRHTGAHHLPFSEVEKTTREARLRNRLQFVPGGKPLIRDEATLDAFLTGLKSDPWIVHFTGHGGYADDEPYLCLADTGMLPARGLPTEPFASTPLVMLNCCVAGITVPMGGSYRGLTDGFLSRGATTVIASSFPVGDFPSMHFSREFYDALFDRQTVGEAILHARQTVAASPDAHPLHWGLFIPWGNVSARLGRIA